MGCWLWCGLLVLVGGGSRGVAVKDRVHCGVVVVVVGL